MAIRSSAPRATHDTRCACETVESAGSKARHDHTGAGGDLPLRHATAAKFGYFADESITGEGDDNAGAPANTLPLYRCTVWTRT